MPTIRGILMRDPDVTATLEDGGKMVTFYKVSETEYDSFSVYLNEFGCTLMEYNVDGNIMTAILEKNGYSFIFSYDCSDGTAVLSYPTGTIEEEFDVASAIEQQELLESFKKIGNIVTYGHYEQDNDLSNGKEAIEWIVVKYDDEAGQALLLSRYGLDRYQFDEITYQGWEKSEIRKWLNSTFLNAAFTAEEQAGIVTTAISTPGYNGNSGGSDTQDKI